MRAEVVPATHDHAFRLWSNLRGDQIENVSGMTPLDLRAQMDKSVVSFCGLLDDEPVIIWGVLMPGLLGNEGVIWALTSNEIDKCPLVFVRRSKIELEKLRWLFKELTGFVAAEYERSARWLAWLGFDVGPSFVFNGKSIRRIKLAGAF